MDIIAICIAIFSFLLTALKYYLDYMKDSLNIDVIPTRSFNYLVDDKSSYNDITFINFTKFPISVIDVEFDIKNKVNEQKTFKPIRYKDKNYSIPFTLGPYESVECTFFARRISSDMGMGCDYQSHYQQRNLYKACYHRIADRTPRIRATSDRVNISK
ncbi:hypothetical protein Y001_10615 [Staphylococcus aureus MUF256]|nr:hypothetical protein Y001_10615 [Staphylococcus aureus MUF256]